MGLCCIPYLLLEHKREQEKYIFATTTTIIKNAKGTSSVDFEQQKKKKINSYLTVALKRDFLDLVALKEEEKKISVRNKLVNIRKTQNKNTKK